MSNVPEVPRDRFVAIEDDIRAVDGVVGVVVFSGADGLPEELQVFATPETDQSTLRGAVGRILAEHGAAAGIRRVYVFEVAVEIPLARNEAHVFELSAEDTEGAAPGARVVDDGGAAEHLGGAVEARRMAALDSAGRVALRTVLLDAGEGRTEARVALERGAVDRSGIAQASATPHSLRVSAVATVEALEGLLGHGQRFSVVGASLVETVGREIVCVVLRDERTDRELVGACAAGDIPVHEAAVRATLDAVNRQVDHRRGSSGQTAE